VERVPTLFSVGVMPVSPRLPLAIRRIVSTADIVHFHEPYPLATLWLLLAPRPRRLVVTWHADIYRQKILKPYAEWVQHRLASRADALFTTTKRMAEHSRFLRRHMDRIRLMPFMIDTKPFDARRDDQARLAAIRERWGGRYALAFGRLVEYKGFDVLIDAVSGTDIRVVMVGQGRLRDSLAAQARARGVAGQIVFAGAVDDETARDLYCACEFFAFPSVHHNEGFGLVQLEAMAAGRPVINTWLPTSVPEVSLDGVSGLTVKPHDADGLRTAMLRLWQDDALRQKLAAGALARVREHFARERVAARICEIYDEILARPSRLAPPVRSIG
jgi:rhamnosyl/mannosyltransferase